MYTNKRGGETVALWQELEIREELNALHSKRRRKEIGIDEYLMEYRRLSKAFDDLQQKRAERRKNMEKAS